MENSNWIEILPCLPDEGPPLPRFLGVRWTMAAKVEKLIAEESHYVSIVDEISEAPAKTYESLKAKHGIITFHYE